MSRRRISFQTGRGRHADAPVTMAQRRRALKKRRRNQQRKNKQFVKPVGWPTENISTKR